MLFASYSQLVHNELGIYLNCLVMLANYIYYCQLIWSKVSYSVVMFLTDTTDCYFTRDCHEEDDYVKHASQLTLECFQIHQVFLLPQQGKATQLENVGPTTAHSQTVTDNVGLSLSCVQAYRKLAKEFHPDKNPDAGDKVRDGQLHK